MEMLAPSLVAGIWKRHHRGVWSSVSAGKLRGDGGGGSWQLSLGAGQLLKCCQPARQQQLKLDSQPHLRAVQNSRTFLTLFCFLFFSCFVWANLGRTLFWPPDPQLTPICNVTFIASTVGSYHSDQSFSGRDTNVDPVLVWAFPKYRFILNR